MILNSMRIGIVSWFMVLTVSLSWGRAVAQVLDVPTARRIAAMAAVALEEYRLGVENGRVVSVAELEEARSFLEEARRAAATLSPPVQDLVVPVLDGLRAGVERRQAHGELESSLAGLRRELERALGVPLDPLPATAPALAAGERTFRERCSECHGYEGRGDGSKAARLKPPPANLTLRDSLSSTSPLDFFRKISVGVSGTEMPAWEDKLSVDDRWAVALYTSGLRHSPVERERGGALLRERCSDCVLLVGDLSETAGLSDDSLRVLLAGRLGRTPGDSGVTAAVAFARTAAAWEVLGGDRGVEAARTVLKTSEAMARALALAQAGQYQAAASAALDAYLVFERIETPLRARDARGAARVEEAFGRFRMALGAGREDEIPAARRSVEEALAAAQRSLTTDSSPAVLFGQSFIIMLREGLEAILIVGALMAFLVKAGASERKREMGWGVIAALIASLVTAGAFATVFRGSTAHREALEGITMLIAAAVLFSVSYWLVSKIEVRKWHAFVTSQIQKALSSRRAWALAAVAFLAVYREGFETVLFYAALFATGRGSAGAAMSISAGILVGFTLLCVVYYVIQRWGMRLPLKPFFGVTSGLLYVMAFSFAGQGIAELQEAGYISATPIRWAPRLPALGVFPTAQTLSIQLVLALALLAALAWVFWLEPRRATATARR